MPVWCLPLTMGHNYQLTSEIVTLKTLPFSTYGWTRFICEVCLGDRPERLHLLQKKKPKTLSCLFAKFQSQESKEPS